MECNKDEALKAKELAETKLLQKDIQGAQKLAKIAHNLCPGLDGLSQLKVTLDVYLSAERRIYGEVDWYGVLGVDPLADDETMRKNYKKLALNLHPDKNKAAGAEGAFKIVSEAWSLLSDKAKKTAYDHKLNERAKYEKVVMQNSSVPTGKNGFHSSVVNQQKTSNRQYAQIFPRLSKPNTFWTKCSLCLMHYEYLRVYLLQRLFCPNCRHPFLAVEIPIPFPHMQHRNPNPPASANNPAPAVGEVGQPSNLTVERGRPPKSGTDGSSVKLKRGREAETEAGGEGEGAFHAKRKADRSAKKSTRKLTLSETRIMLIAKARNEIRNKLEEWDFASKEELCKVQKDNADAPAVDMKKAVLSGLKKGDINHDSALNIKKNVQPKHSSKPSAIVDLDVEPIENVKEELPKISKRTEGKGIITYSRKRVRKNPKESKGKEGAVTAVVAKEKQVMDSR